MKNCTKCLENKPNESFHKSKLNKSGLSSWCKECDYKRSKYYRENNRDTIRKNLKQWQNSNRDKVKEYNKKFRIKNGKRSRIYMMVWRAVRKGIIFKTPCFVCGNPIVEAHHHDYNKPLDVIWLCRYHHKQEHSYFPILTK